MILLAVETSCDETSVAVVKDGLILANLVASQIQLHAEYGGVVPELAARAHLQNLPPMIAAALAQAQVAPAELQAVAATQGPGLPNALLVGLKSAQAMAFALRLPFIGINHHEAHLYSPWIAIHPMAADFVSFQPNVSLIVSGGHTMLVHVRAELDHAVLGATIDDAAGECFDKAAKLIGLSYPGGPEIERLANGGNPRAFDFPRPMLRDSGDDFSFSGLKTAVRYFVRDHPEIMESAAGLSDLCASIQAAIVEVLAVKTIRAAVRLGVSCVTASGGVTCNNALRAALTESCAEKNLSLRLAEKMYSTDNAAMIAILAERKLLQKKPLTEFDAEIMPGWSLA